jgi:opine dehydrogenase
MVFELNIAILGCGAGGMAMAIDLGLKGHTINLFDMMKFDQNIKDIQKRGGIEATNRIVGFYKPNKVTTNAREAVSGADIIMVTARAFGHQELLKTVIQYLDRGQIILIWTSYFSSLRFYNFVKAKVPQDIILAESNILPYFVKIVAPATVEVYNKKSLMKIAAMPSQETGKVMDIVKQLYPQCIAAENVLETSLDNPNIPVHVPPALLNTGYWERTEGNISFYGDLITPKVAKVIDAVDKERVAVGSALGMKLTPINEMLVATYGVTGKTTYEAFQNLSSHSAWRPRVSLEDFASKAAFGEDILYGFVPISSLGDQLDVDTKTIDSLTNLASLITGRDYWAEGATTEKLGLAGMAVPQIIEYVTTGRR